jgi:hypothetical protein
MREDRPKPRTEHEKELLQYLFDVREVRLKNHHRSGGNFKYAGFEDYLIQHGTFFTPKHLPPTVRPMMVSQCYENAFRVASRSKAFHYVEGVALSLIPVDHAFCVNAEGDVVDPTWASGRTELGLAYIGVELDLTEVKASRRVGTLSLSGDYRRGWPVLQGKEVRAKDAWFSRG